MSVQVYEWVVQALGQFVPESVFAEAEGLLLSKPGYNHTHSLQL